LDYNYAVNQVQMGRYSTQESGLRKWFISRIVEADVRLRILNEGKKFRF
jgi:hypothetical protein